MLGNGAAYAELAYAELPGTGSSITTVTADSGARVEFNARFAADTVLWAEFNQTLAPPVPGPNDSSTGGPLLPKDSPPLEGLALNNFLQGWLVGISGLPSTLVRPSFQSEPPIIPDAETVWMTFRYHERKADEFPWIGHLPGDADPDQLQRHEGIRVLCSFYDTGTNGQADFFAAQTRDMTAIAQNWELLYLNDFVFVVCGDLVTVPQLVKTRWLYRVDLPIILRRQIIRTYGIQTVQSLSGSFLITDSGLKEPISVPQL